MKQTNSWGRPQVGDLVSTIKIGRIVEIADDGTMVQFDDGTKLLVDTESITNNELADLWEITL